MKDVSVAMVALGGYGNFYLERLFNDYEAQNFRLVAGIDPNPIGCRWLDRFESHGIPIYPDLDTFYAKGHADLVMIAAPIHLHKPFTLKALSEGSSVLCEKPVTATIQDAMEMAEAEAKHDGFVAVGYQWSYADAMQALKRDIIDGVLGKPLRFTTKVLWPRPLSYYSRNSWAARLKAPDGSWILDSPANNATAHYLHNCFYVLGAARETSARPVDVEAELYRANEIENYDTAAIHTRTEDGVDILFLTSHPVEENIGPTLKYEFEHAVVEFDDRGATLKAVFRDGRMKDYGDPFADDGRKIWECIDAVRTGAKPACGIQAATSHTICVNGAQESPSRIIEFPQSLVRREKYGMETLVYVEGLLEVLQRCYEDGRMPSTYEDVTWAQAARRVDLRRYDHYPSFTR
jgi:predicted dehydrogenase